MQGVFFDSGDVGAADVKVAGDFPLCLFSFAEKTEAAADHFIFFFRENGFHGPSTWRCSPVWNIPPPHPRQDLPLRPED